MQQKIDEIESLPQVVKDRLGFDTTLMGAQRKHLMDELVKGLKNQARTLATKKEEEKKAFEQFVGIIHVYYKELEKIHQRQSDLKDPKQRLALAKDMLNASKKCASELNRLSRDFYTGNYVGALVGPAVLLGLFMGVLGTILYDALLLAFCAATGAGMPPVLLLTLLPLAVYFLEGVILNVLDNICYVAKDKGVMLGMNKPFISPSGLTGAPSNLLFGVFGFFQQEAAVVAEFRAGIKDEAEKVCEELKTLPTAKCS